MIFALSAGFFAALLGALIGWALVKWTNIAIARLWAILLLLVIIGTLVFGMIRGGEEGITTVVFATLVLLPGLIGSVLGMVLTEWRQGGK